MYRLILLAIIIFGVQSASIEIESIEGLKIWAQSELDMLSDRLTELSGQSMTNEEMLKVLDEEVKKQYKKISKKLEAVATSTKINLDSQKQEVLELTDTKVMAAKDECKVDIESAKEMMYKNEADITALKGKVDPMLDEHESAIMQLKTFQGTTEETLLSLSNSQKQISGILPYFSGESDPTISGFSCMTPSDMYVKLASTGDIREKIDVMVTIIEMDIMCDKDAMQNIRETVNLIKSSPLTILNVTDLGKEYKAKGRYFSGFVLFYSAAKMVNTIGNRGVLNVLLRIQDTRQMIEAWAKDGKNIESIVRTYILPLLDDLMEDLKGVRFAVPAFKTEYEAWGLRDLGMIYNSIHDYDQFAEKNEMAIQLMKRELKEKASEYRVFGVITNNAGAAYVKLNNLKLALERYDEALVIYEKVLNWPSESSKAATVELTQNNRNIVATKLRP